MYFRLLHLMFEKLSLKNWVWKIEFEKLSLNNWVWIIELDILDFLSTSNLNFAGCTGSKNPVQTSKKSSFILVARIDPWNTLIPNLVLVYLFDAWKASEKGFKGRRSWSWNSRKKFHYCKTVLKLLDGISESRSLELSSTTTEKEKS